MYSGYTSTTLTLRAKGSFFYNERFGDSSPSPDFPIPLNPRFLYAYFLRQSALVHWSTSRSFLSDKARFFRLDRWWVSDMRRCCGCRASCRASCRDGRYREMIGLLTDSECCNRESIAIGKFQLGHSRWNPNGKVEVDEDRRWSSRKGGAHEARKDLSRLSCHCTNSSSLSGDFETKRDKCRRIVGEYLDDYSKYGYEDSEAYGVEKEVQEVGRHKNVLKTRDAFWFRKSDGSTRGSGSDKASEQEIWDRKEKNSPMMDRARGSREGYIQEEHRSVGRRRSREGSQEFTLTSARCEDTKRAPNFKNVDDTRKVANRRSEIEQRAVGTTESSSRKHTEISEIHGSNVKRATNSRKDFEETRLNLKDREHASTSVQNLVASRDKRIQTDQHAVDKVTTNQTYGNRINVSQTRSGDTEMLDSSKRHDEARADDREYYTTSALNLVRGSREQHHQINESVNHQYSSTRTSERSESEKVSNSQEISTSRIDHEGRSNSEMINRFRDSREEQEQPNKYVDRQYSSRRASDTGLSEFSSSQAKRVSNSQGISITGTRNQKEASSSASDQDMELKQKSVLRGESSKSERTKVGFTGISEGNSSSLHTQIQDSGSQTSRYEAHLLEEDHLESVTRFNKSSSLFVGEFVDKLRQQMSTSVELENTSSRSDIRSDQVHEEEIRSEEVLKGTSRTTTDIQLGVLDAAYKDETYTLESARQYSSMSGMKGPSDEMWDVRGANSQEPSKRESKEDSSGVGVVESTTPTARTENSIARRSPRSLWTYIADIMRIGWNRAGLKSGTRSSSNESVSSETWFSGHEPDENDDEIDKKERDDTQKESVQIKLPEDPSNLRAVSVPSQASSEAPRVVGDEIQFLEADSSTSNSSVKRSPLSKGTSPVSIPAELQFDPSNMRAVSVTSQASSEPSRSGDRIQFPETGSPTSNSSIKRSALSKGTSVSIPADLQSTKGEKVRQGVPSSAVMIDQPSASTGGILSPTIEEEITVIGSPQTTGVGFVTLGVEENLVRERQPEVDRTEGRDWELKQRKLQRNKQVLKEQFDEWEDAFKRENEQRKMDEFFMREALLEARKAADTWEVPVGAVLVQDGKIIARGCNLVEELRDSTAHAEMICIREASSILRTWRLAETTLYVTLEPCAMCAGAILQARIDTVVWGAPNKLLGADGSWVRLFPGEDGGSSSLDESSQRVGPVHPFHPKIVVRRGILATECSDVMQHFFHLRRKMKKQLPPPSSCLPISAHPTKFFTKMHNFFSATFCL